MLCGALVWLIKPPTAAADDGAEPLAVWLLIDNSNSMYEKGGVGSDPELLRLDAARLFLSYLGVDERDVVHRAGIIFFGTGADTAVPLTSLTNDNQRTQLFAQIADPPRMGWTDHLAGLQLAREKIEDGGGNGRPAIILLTDGRPEWPELSSATAQNDYQDALRTQGEALAADNVPLFIILLANETSTNDAAIANIWQPLWQEMSQAVPPGRFFVAQTAHDLLPIYHEIVVALTGEQTAGAVLETDAPVSGVKSTFTVQPNLAQLTLVISKADPAQ
ncbi:MAG: VWA domain-containing protein [Chloroflexi bacterium]|nr:VWA domain-containing protein [Chloroflexota bacterium]